MLLQAKFAQAFFKTGSRMFLKHQALGRPNQSNLPMSLFGNNPHGLKGEGLIVEVMEGMNNVHVSAAMGSKRHGMFQEIAHARVVRLGARQDNAIG